MTTSINDLLSLAGRVVVVTGGGRGIGRGASERLAQAGATVVVAERNMPEAHEVAEAIREAGGIAHARALDVTDQASVRVFMGEVRDEFGGLDVLVNDAGVFEPALLLETDAAAFDHVIEVNLRGMFRCTHAAAAIMVAQGRGGAIVNVTSVDAVHPARAGLGAYDASKHGAWGFTKNIALELAPHGIRVNAVAPAAIRTPGHPTAWGADIPEGHMGTPDDVGRVVLFLASDMSSYMTGAQIVVDGGLLLT